jgi:hypothetical protein
VLDLCRKHGISDATFYNWKAKYNTERTHSSLDDLTPEEFKEAHASRRSADRVRKNLEHKRPPARGGFVWPSEY